MEIKSQKKRIETVAKIIKDGLSTKDIANHEVARYYTGVMINIANEMNIVVGNIISRASLDPDSYRLSGSKYKNKLGCIKDLSKIDFGVKLDMLDSIAKKMDVPNNEKEKISILRNLPAHAVIVMDEKGKALLWDKYDINEAPNNDIEKLLNDFLNEAQTLEEFCREIIRKMDAIANAA